MSNKTQNINPDNDYNHHSSRSGMTKCKFTKDFKRHKEDKHREEKFWKRLRKIRYQKQSREDNYVEPSDTESQETVEPTIEHQATDLDLHWAAHRKRDVPIVCPALYTRPRFCDLLVTATPFDVANTIDAVNDVLMYRQISSHRFNGDAVFFRELGLWKCTFDDNGPHQHSGSFEIRMMSDFVGLQRLMLVLTRTSGDNLDGDTCIDQDGYVEALGPNETFFRYIADKFDR